jgi:hypothetical protein
LQNHMKNQPNKHKMRKQLQVRALYNALPFGWRSTAPCGMFLCNSLGLILCLHSFLQRQ